MTSSAPTDITLLQGFVNTANLEDETDEISTAPALQTWLTAAGVLHGTRRLTRQDHARAIDVREALRDLIGVNIGEPLSPEARGRLDNAATRAALHVRFCSDGSTAIEPSASGLDGALGRILVAAHLSMAHGTWAQLKLCNRGCCRWAFYDTSKNQSKRWCSMEVCGNRSKGEAFRGRHKTPPASTH